MTDCEEERSDSPTDGLKIIMVGNSGIGKSAFLTRFTDNIYDSVPVHTVAIDYKEKTLSR